MNKPVQTEHHQEAYENHKFNRFAYQLMAMIYFWKQLQKDIRHRQAAAQGFGCDKIPFEDLLESRYAN